MDKKLCASPDKKLLGVCGGFGDYFNIDPTIIRIAFVLMAIYTAVIPTLVLYFVFSLIMPQPDETYYQTHNPNYKKLTKGSEVSVAGVCSGIAEYLNIDFIVVRIAFAFLAFVLCTGVFAYIACAVLMPKKDAYKQYTDASSFENRNGQYNN